MRRDRAALGAALIAGIALGFILFVLVVAAANARQRTMCQRATSIRPKVIRLHGRRAPGRDICKVGMRHGGHPSKGQRAHYLRALKALVSRPRYPTLIRTAVPPPVPPAGTATAAVAATGQAACIVQRESRGNPQAVNGQYHGIAQWSHEAWIRHGGGRYASDPLGATKQQQLDILASALSRYGSRDWSPYDGC